MASRERNIREQQVADLGGEAHSTAMNLLTTVTLLAIASGGSLPETPPDRNLAYVTAVTFAEGKCRFWTGDVGLTADQFRDDLESRYDRRRSLVVKHAANVPARCVRIAVRSAKRAGFKRVKSEVHADAGAMGPPVSER